jgi:pentatricopeptide repeat protein
MGALEKGEQIRDHIIDRGLLKDVVLANALLDMYVKCGRVSEARGILEELPVRDIVSWSTIISGYARQGQGDEALKCFAKMRAEGISPNVVTFLCLLRACGAAGAVREGERIHDEIRGRGMLAKDAMLGNALVGMYANCGELSRARKALKELPIRNVAAWNALIAGHARRGQAHEVLRFLEAMECEGISPDEVTLLSVLNACGHSGLVDEAQIIFGEMTRRYGISPSLQHRTCMVMAFGCGGYLEKAAAMIEAIPSLDDRCLSIWIALLGGCRKWGDAVLGMLAFSGALQVDTDCAAAYELMANIFASAGMQADAEKVGGHAAGRALIIKAQS